MQVTERCWPQGINKSSHKTKVSTIKFLDYWK
jgi:hypothetical protein